MLQSCVTYYWVLWGVVGCCRVLSAADGADFGGFPVRENALQGVVECCRVV